MDSTRGNITWLSYTVVDIHLHTSRALEIMRYMGRRGYQNKLIACRSRKNSPAKIRNQHMILMPIRYKSFISSIIFAIVILFYLPIHMIASKPRYVIVSADVSIFSVIPYSFLSRLFRTKFVLDIRSTPVEMQGLSGIFRKLVFHMSVLIAKDLFDGITIITTQMRDQLCSFYKIDPHRVGVWTSGVSVDAFDPQKYSSAGKELKRKLGLEGKFVVFYHGVLSSNRGITVAGKGIEMIKPEHPDIVLFLLGKPVYPELDELLLEKDLQDNIIIHTPVAYEDVPKFVSLSDLCIVPLLDLPRWRFQSPLKLLEYLAMEKVVVISNIPAHREVISAEPCGIYMRTVSVSEIARLITWAYSHRNILADMGKSGRRIVQNEYSWEIVARDLDNYLSSIK